MTASRGGGLEGLIAVLDPDVVLHSDATASPSGAPLTVHGAATVAGGARAASARSRYGRIALVNGAPGLIMAPRGQLLVALAFTFSGEKISQMNVVADPDRLAAARPGPTRLTGLDLLSDQTRPGLPAARRRAGGRACGGV